MSKISIGDEVIVHKPSDPWEYPYWTYAMDKYVGKVMSVISVCESDNTVRLHGAGTFYFNIIWLELVTTDDDFNTEIGSLYG